MKGERLALSGVNPLGGNLRRSTSCDRMTSMSTRSSNAQAMKPTNAMLLGVIMANSLFVKPNGYRSSDIPGVQFIRRDNSKFRPLIPMADQATRCETLSSILLKLSKFSVRFPGNVR